MSQSITGTTRGKASRSAIGKRPSSTPKGTATAATARGRASLRPLLA